MQKFKIFGLSVGIPAAALLFLRLMGVGALAGEEGIYKSLDMMCDVMGIIQRDYIDRVSSDRLVRDAVQGMLSSLDSYSHYVPPPTPGAGPPAEPRPKERLTFGLEIAYKNKMLTVVSPVEYGPAWRSGLRSGDIIVKIDDESIEELPLFEFLQELRSGALKELKLQIARRGERDFINVTVKPGKIDGPAAQCEVLQEKVGKLRLSRFDAEAVARARDCLKKLKEEGALGIIVDLRDCPEGDIPSAVKIADLFLPPGAVITTLEGRIQGADKVFKAKEKAVFDKGPFVVLINGGTSGAAEILAGALSGSAGGIVMGQKSFGCAFEDSSFPMKDGSKIFMITAVYQTPYGREIQGEGIEPDIETSPAPVAVEAEEEEEEEVNREEKPVKEKKEPGEKKVDLMMQRAIDLVKGIRIVTHEEAR